METPGPEVRALSQRLFQLLGGGGVVLLALAAPLLSPRQVDK